MRRPTILSMRGLQVAATATALLFAQAPAFAQPAGPAPAPTTSPAPEPAPEAPPAEPAPEAAEPEPAPEPPGELGAWEPGAPQPEPEPAPAPQAEPEPEPEPAAAAPIGPEPPPAAPVDAAGAQRLRTSGVGTMIAGGVISLVGFGMTLGLTVRGNKLERDLVGAEEAYQIDDCSRVASAECDRLTRERDDIRDGILKADRLTAISGGILAGGLLVTAIGGIIYRVGVRRLTDAHVARVRVSPSFGGLSISGSF